MPYRSKAQARWAHATGQPWAGEWDEATKRVKKGKKKGFKALPDRVEKSSYAPVVQLRPLSSLKRAQRARKVKLILLKDKRKSAFGVSKRERSTVPTWASGVLPASTVRAYDYSNRNKKKAAANNFAARAGGAAIGSAAGLGLAALAIKTKKVPSWVLKDTKIAVKGKKPIAITAGEKKRYVGGLASTALGGVVGGAAGQQHLRHVQNSPRYDYGRKKR